MNRGAVVFSVESSQYHKGGKLQDYRGQIDGLGMFCPDSGKVYLVPIDDLPLVREAKLRLRPPGNPQERRIRWAARYEI